MVESLERRPHGKALYNHYRPRTFAEVRGQQEATGALIRALESGNVHHAYLFSGPRGCGKTSSARIMAASLNCVKGITSDPCGACDQCVAIRSGTSLDVLEIDAASHGGVDDTRDLRERVQFAPVSARFKVCIIDEAHMITTQGFNALLKVVEEPPEFVRFIFATTEPDKVIPTIRSRTFHYQFRLVPPAELMAHLQDICDREGVPVDPRALRLVVRAGEGSVRDSLSVLDQLIASVGAEGLTYDATMTALGFTDAVLLDETVEALGAGDGAAVFEIVDRVIGAGHDPSRFARDLLKRLRDLIVVAAVPEARDRGLVDGFADDALERMKAQVALFGPAGLSRAADLVHAGLVEMRGTTSPRLLLELVCARILLPAGAHAGITGHAGQPSTTSRPGSTGMTAREAAKAAVAPPAAPPPHAQPAPAPAARAGRAEAQTTQPLPPDPAAGSTGSTSTAGPAGLPTDSPAGSTGSVEKAPVASPAPNPGADGLTLQSVEAFWPRILEAGRSRKVMHTLLTQYGELTAASGHQVTISFSLPTIARQFEGQRAEQLEETIAEVLGQAVKVVVAVGGAGAPAASTAGKPARPSGNAPAPATQDFAPGDEALPDDQEPAQAPVSGEDAAMALLQQGLGATVIGEVGRPSRS